VDKKGKRQERVYPSPTWGHSIMRNTQQQEGTGVGKPAQKNNKNKCLFHLESTVMDEGKMRSGHWCESRLFPSVLQHCMLGDTKDIHPARVTYH